MKNKYLFAIIPSLLFVAGFGSSCQKESKLQAASGGTDTISYRIYSPSLKIDSCGSTYMIDLDMDGVPDAQLSMSCVSGQWITDVYCGPWYYSYTYSVNLDTIFNNKMTLLAKSPQLNTGVMDRFDPNDTISSSHSIGRRTGCILSHESRQYPALGFEVVPVTGMLYGVRKTDAAGDKYGWIKISCDKTAALYLDGTGMNNAPDKPILAGQY